MRFLLRSEEPVLGVVYVKWRRTFCKTLEFVEDDVRRSSRLSGTEKPLSFPL